MCGACAVCCWATISVTPSCQHFNLLEQNVLRVYYAQNSEKFVHHDVTYLTADFVWESDGLEFLADLLYTCMDSSPGWKIEIIEKNSCLSVKNMHI